jgi:hypothetical protein
VQRYFLKIIVFQNNDKRIPKKLCKSVNREEIPNEKIQWVENLLIWMTRGESRHRDGTGSKEICNSDRADDRDTDDYDSYP